MGNSYFFASLKELAYLAIGLAVVHSVINALLGIHILATAWADFTGTPIPEWSWSAWLVAGLVAFVVVIELCYRAVMVDRRNRRRP